MIAIRPYCEADSLPLLRLFKRSVRELANRDYSPSQILAWAPDDRDPLQFAARCAAKSTFVAETNGKIAGFGVLNEEGYIDMLYVDPDFARRGVATALLDFIAARARKNGLCHLFSDVSLTAKPAFEKNGFKSVTAQTVEFNGQTFKNFRMEKIL